MQKLLLFPFGFMVSCGFCQTKISGKITDGKKNPLQGISVAIVNSYDGATTDSLGNFSFIMTEKGEQILKVTATGYKIFEEKYKYCINTDRFKCSIKRRNYPIKSRDHQRRNL